jgi:DsbC/DsbD-like thiol-disulfide interchange protein
MNSKAPLAARLFDALMPAYSSRLLPAVIAMCLAVPPTVVAQTPLTSPSNAPLIGASSWDGSAHSAARLIAGATSKDRDIPFLRAGIEIKLDPGWQTYWRDPGDSGAPPIIDFAGSENVKAVNVLWPAPEKFSDGAGGYSIGYRDRVVLPLHVVPAESTKQTALRLKLDYDICSNICIPVESNLVLNLAGDSAENATIEQAELRVPRPVTLGQKAHPDTTARGNPDPHSGGLAILGIHRQPGDAHDRVLVDVAAPEGAPVDLFVEGPTPDWSLPLPQQGAAEGAVRHFEFELEGLPPGAKTEGAALTLTAVSGDDAIEVSAHLD